MHSCVTRYRYAKFDGGNYDTQKRLEYGMSGNRWFRFYAEALNDPKVDRLPPSLYKTWVKLLCLACTHDRGLLPSVDDIAYHFRISVTDAGQQLDELILSDLIDINADKSMTPHNWGVRQYLSDTSAARTRKYREKKKARPTRDVTCDVTCDVTVTPPEQNRTDSETEFNLLTSEQDAPHEEEIIVKIDSKFEEKKVLKRGRVSPDLRARAEGLGLPVAALAARAEGEATLNVDGLFQTLCKARIREMLPGVSDRLIGRAMSTDAAARARVMELLIHAMEER